MTVMTWPASVPRRQDESRTARTRLGTSCRVHLLGLSRSRARPQTLFAARLFLAYRARMFVEKQARSGLPTLPCDCRSGRSERVTEVVCGLSSALRAFQEFRQLLVATTDRLRVLVACERSRLRAKVHQVLDPQHQVIHCGGYADTLVRLATDAIDAVVVEDRIGQVGPRGDLLIEIRNRWPLLRRVLVVPAGGRPIAGLEPGAAHVSLRAPLDPSALLASLRADGSWCAASAPNGSSSLRPPSRCKRCAHGPKGPLRECGS